MDVLIKGPGFQNKKLMDVDSLIVEVGGNKFVVSPAHTNGRLLIRSFGTAGIVVHPINLFTITVEAE